MSASNNKPQGGSSGGVEDTIADAIEVEAGSAAELLWNAAGRMFMKMAGRVKELQPGDFHEFTMQLEYRADPDRIVATGKHAGVEKGTMLVKRKQK